MTRVQPIAPLVALDYASPLDARPARRAVRRRVALLALALPGLVVPFVNFTYSITPLEVVTDLLSGWLSGEPMIYLLASSYFAAIPIVAWQVRRLAWSATPRRWERVMLFIVAGIATAPATGVVGLMIYQVADDVRASTQPSVDGEAIVMTMCGLAPLALGLALSAWRWRCGKRLAAAESLLVTGYLANAAVCFFAFHDNPDPGYWLSLAPTAAFALDLLRPRSHATE